MNITHDDVVVFAKSFGMLYLFAIFIGFVIYACWPSLGSRFERAANSVLDDEEGPCLKK